MIVELVGFWFRAMARALGGDHGRELEHVGAELQRLGRRRA
jgi:hypothetical protein